MFACWALTFCYTLWNIRKSRREKLCCLHENLKQIHLAWSNNEADLKPANSVDFSEENRSEQRWFLIAGVVLSFASWLGFFILAVLIMSMEFLAKPRLEKAIFKSELVCRKLPPAVVQKIVDEIAAQ